MANQVIVTNTGNVQVALTPPANVQVQISRAAIGTVSNVPTANFANYAANVTASNQPNITNVGTLGNLSVTGTVTSGNVSTPTVYNNGMQMQGYDFVQMQYSNGATLPVSPYDIGVGSWFYLDPGGAVWQSNTTGTLKTVILGNDGGINADGNVSAPYYIGNGSQLTGIVATGGNANYANFAGNVTGANQPNITNVGTLGNLSVSNTITTLNLNVTGNLAVGNLVANSANYANYAGQANTANLATYATTANAVAGANVSGEVANANFASYSEQANLANLATYATTANSVAVANVSGIGNIATTNYDNDAGNVLYGNGGFYALPTISNVANANYSNFAGQVVDNTQSNITQVGTLSNLTISGDTNSNNIIVANDKVIYASQGSYGPPDGTFANVRVGLYGTNPTYAIGVESNHSWIQGQDGVKLYTGSNVALVANSNGVTTNKFYADAGVNANVGYGFTGTPNTAMCSSNTNEITFYNNTIESLSLYANNNAKFYANLTANYYFGDGSQLSNINGGNVSNVANANYANFAGTAYSVDGANVSGTVANANFAAYSEQANNANLATYATTANAVAGANVSGEVANANYANFSNVAYNVDGKLINNLDTNGKLIVGAPYGAAQLDLTLGASINAFRGLAGPNGGIQLNTSPNNTTESTWTFGYNGNLTLPGNTFAVNYANGSPVNLDGPVANANYANFAGTAYSVDGANVSGTVANANFAAYSEQANNANLATFATTANAVAGANVSGVVANANYAAYSEQANNANLATFATTANAVAGGNVSGTVANANFAAYAGNVTVNAQANITTVGNLLTLNVVNATANSTQFLFSPTGTNVGVSGQNAASYIVNQFTTQPGTSNAQVLNFQFTAARGNSTNPANVANSDFIGRMAWNSFNGNTYIRNALINVLAPQGGNTAQQGANVAWGAGSFFLNTGNPLGNITSNTTNTTQNLLNWSPFGTLSLTPGTPGPNAAVQNAVVLQSYGSNTDGAGSTVNRILFQRSRGNRDSSVAVANGDGAGSFTFTAYNGNGYVGSSSLYAVVDTSYGSIAPGNVVPLVFNFSLSNGNGTISTTSFKPDGNVVFPGGNSVVAVNNLNVGASGGTNGLLKLSSYTAAALTAITGTVGQMAAVTNSASGGNPNGMIAFWDTSNSRWSYVHDNSAV